MSNDFKYAIKSICFDENYHPTGNTRITTNFANLARGESRKENLRNALRMVDSRFNALAHWDNPKGDRYTLELEIVSVDIERIPHHTITLNDAQKDEVNLLVEKLEEDEDVQNVFHNAIL